MQLYGNNAMDVTIAICTWNRSESLRRTLEQFTRLEADAGCSWELLVVNNNSTDGTDAVVESFGSRLPVRLLHESQAGQSYARNLAIREARGRVIAWTDDDVLVEPDWLTALMKAFAEFDADWVFGRSAPYWPESPPSWYSTRVSGLFAELDYGAQAFIVADRDKPFYGLNHAGTAQAHKRLNGYRTEFGLKGEGGGVGEDVDIFERAFAAGMKIVYTPAALVHHVIPEDRTRKRWHRHRMWVSNEVVFKYLPHLYPNVPMLLGLPRFFFRHAAHDLAAYTGAMLRRHDADAFPIELRLLRFGRLLLEAARNGFRAPSISSRVLNGLES